MTDDRPTWGFNLPGLITAGTFIIVSYGGAFVIGGLAGFILAKAVG